MRSNGIYTQRNLKGKKTLRLSCGCCEMQNFKEKYQNKQELKMILDYFKMCDKDFLAKEELYDEVY